MDPKLKIAIAVVAGALGGMLLLGVAFAVPAAFHFVAGPTPVADQEFGPGMMGRGGIMGPQGQWDGETYPDYGPRGGRGGMMGPRGGYPGDGVCPNLEDGTCPYQEDATDTAL